METQLWESEEVGYRGLFAFCLGPKDQRHDWNYGEAESSVYQQFCCDSVAIKSCSSGEVSLAL